MFPKSISGTSCNYKNLLKPHRDYFCINMITITKTQYDRHGNYHERMVWVSLNDIFIGTFELIGGVEWRFRTGSISGLNPIQLKKVADELDKINNEDINWSNQDLDNR